MKCPQCISEGSKSFVNLGGSLSTLMCSDPFYDEDGKYHNHDPNTSVSHYACSNGHKWTELSKPSCWCGWPNKDKK